MAKEVERKFLVTSDDWRGQADAKTAIRQFYLAAADGRSFRVRIRDGSSAVLTLKFGAHERERDEFEYPIPLSDAEEMQKFAVGLVIEKVRHQVRHNGYVYEVDVFAGALAGLVIAELETPDDVRKAKLPPWLGREITGESAFYNASLARNGLPVAA
ncbi:CYTH domain-containing protein [Mesorhizobium sp. WSM2239]|uniref:CYTH domain-containing protein n=2 Tax=unclassified Mesorhizobium TaxID=325217 RepID=A0AAU8DAP4_9HYPH